MEKSQQTDKAVRLIEYLLRLAGLRRKPVKDIAKYHQVLWLHEIPKHKGCFTQAWGSDKEYDESIWLEVQSRREPPLPKIPNLCQDWIDRETLHKKTDIPLLKETITRQVENVNWSEDSDQPQFFSEPDSLNEHPDIPKKWEQYIDQKWMPWTEEHNEWEAIQKVYSKLFSIYQEQLKLGEQYELVLGLGLLTWQTPQNQQLQRHLFIATASLEFESRLGKFTIRPDAGGANLHPELEMLEGYQPPKAEEIAKEGLAIAEDNPWNQGATEGVMTALVHSIDSGGEYHNRPKAKSPRNTDKPMVEYAPALILRKRSVKGQTDMLRKLKSQIEDGEIIPPEFRDLAEIQHDGDREPDIDKSGSCPEFNGEVYFPKPFNKEQRQIIEKLNHTDGLLIQGPPGTGKTHTIANLICHLLATGKRILITAKTPRALRVIEQQLPPQVRPLCVNLLGSGVDERVAMEKSTEAVLQKTQRWNSDKKEAVRGVLENKLKTLRSEGAGVEARLRAIRESETHSQIIADGTYRGTAAQIARSVKADSAEFDWFKDKIAFDTNYPFDPQTLSSLLKGLRTLTETKRTELQLLRPSSLPTEEQIQRLFENEVAAKEKEQQAAPGSHTEFLERLWSLDEKTIVSVGQALARLRDQLQKLHASPCKWINTAIRDISAGHDSTWQELCTVTDTGVSGICDIVREADSTELTISDDLDPKIIYKDAKSLRDILSDGKKLGWGPFRSKIVRPFVYLTKTLQIDGRECKSIEQLTTAMNLLRVQLQLKHLWNFWKGKAEPCEGPYSLQFRELETHCSTLREALSVSETIERCRQVMPGHGNSPAIIWHDESIIIRFVQACKYAWAKLNTNKAADAIQDIIRPLQKLSNESHHHPVVAEIQTSIESRSIDDYIRARSHLRELQAEQVLYDKTKSLQADIARQIPLFMSDLAESYNESYWGNRLQAMEGAWNWARAKSWLNDYINKEDVISLTQRVSQIENEIETTMAKLASNKAWSFCFSRMSEHHRRHMQAWQQSMKKVGKGTGKHAPKHRREAQHHLNECRDAVPAWVMPLHRVWDTVEPSTGMFDVVIVDEASQCGMEALPLLYLGKKILIVGDDKQIAPDAVGVPQDAVHRLMDEYLHDYEFKTSFGVGTSLFDQGKIRYTTQQIGLREHFRCMPEIIRFSNDLCYSGGPLIPLRQYGADRLKPLEKVYVPNGYREGRGGRVINHPEAEVIAAKIVELCGHSQYTGKTMGVVILQGEAQASLIEHILLEQLGAEEMECRRLICGNPYSFQGDERDVIFMSMVAAPNERIGPLTKLADERRFNVAASRAKDQMWLFHSVTRNDLNQSCLRSRLLEFFEDNPVDPIENVDCEKLERQAFEINRSVVGPPQPFDSWFEVDVALELARKKYRVIPQFEVAGKYIDLVIDGGGSRLAVECDGDAFHGVDHYEQDMERQKILERCGWAFFRIRECEFCTNKDAVLFKLWRALEDRQIFPIGMEPVPKESEKGSHIPEDEDPKNIGGETLGKIPASRGQLFHPLEGINDPSNIHEAMQMNYSALRDAIIATLKSRPNQSCVKDSVVKYLLQYLEIISRGKPREAFAYKVDQVIRRMDEAGILKIYTATNERVKLKPEPYLSMALGKDFVSE